MFPPEIFLGYPKTRISADLTAEVSRKESDPLRRDQYLYLLQFWGGQPERLGEAILPDGVFEAFGLPALDGIETKVIPNPINPLPNQDKEKTKDKDRDKVEPFVEREPLAIRQFVEKINEWRGGGILGQVEANRIRGWINTHILHSINWESELLRSVKPTTNTHATSIYLPRAKGNPPSLEKAFVVVANDEQFDDAAIANDIFSAIRAMLRYDHYNGWDYDQADDDYIAVSNFVDGHVESASSWIHAKYKNIDGSPVASLTQALLWQARLLNIETAHKSDDASQMDAIFAAPSERSSPDDDREWNDFLDELASSRKLLQDELLERVAAFQGTGKSPHAVDASQLLDVIQDFRRTWRVSEKFPQVPGSALDELKAIDQHISSIIRMGKSKIEERRKRIADQSILIVAELGKEYDKNDLLKDLEEVCSLSEQRGLNGVITVAQVRKLAERFKMARAIREVGEQVEAIVVGDDIAIQMTTLARFDIRTHSLLVEFAETCSKFLKERAGKAQGQILAWTPQVVETKKAEVHHILSVLEDAVSPFRKADL